MDKIHFHLDIAAAAKNTGTPAKSKTQAGKQHHEAKPQEKVKEQEKNDESDAHIHAHPDNKEKDVTFLFYMNGQYSDMEQTMAAALRNLETAGSDENVNLVAQLGRASQKESRPYGGTDRIDNDWSGVRRYYVVNQEENSASEPTIEQFKAIAEKMPKNPMIHQLLGDVYAKTGHRNFAYKEYKMAEELGFDKCINEPESETVKKWTQQLDKGMQPLRDANMDNFIYKSEALEKSDKIDMMKPAALKDFVSWGMKNFPSKHYVLVLMGHGGAWSGSMKMTPAQISDAINAGVDKANEATDREDKIDTLVFNSCYMGNLETMHEVSDSADITIGSQMSARTSIFHQWTPMLKKVQKQLEEGGEFDPVSFATDYVNYYKKLGREDEGLSAAIRQSRESFLTLTAVDNKKIALITAAWGRLVKDWEESGIDNKEIFKHIKESKDFGSDAFNGEQSFDYSSLKDLGQVAINIINDPKVPAKIKDDCRQIRAAMREAIIAEQHTGVGMEDSTGLTVWAPVDAREVSEGLKYYELNVPKFNEETKWSDKLESALEKVDTKTLNTITHAVQNLNLMSVMMETPGLTAKEKKSMKEKMQILENEINQLKKEVMLTEADKEK
ncbi:MAG: clostripain-related cysteine peptidase [Firmicutes bacterium]|nr:clostripain-related cysteine peptidase [Bacillota bacterium]